MLKRYSTVGPAWLKTRRGIRADLNLSVMSNLEQVVRHVPVYYHRSIFPGLVCYQCTRSSSNEDCASQGTTLCSSNQGSCETEIRIENGIFSVEKVIKANSFITFVKV